MEAIKAEDRRKIKPKFIGTKKEKARGQGRIVMINVAESSLDILRSKKVLNNAIKKGGSLVVLKELIKSFSESSKSSIIYVVINSKLEKFFNSNSNVKFIFFKLIQYFLRNVMFDLKTIKIYMYLIMVLEIKMVCFFYLMD